ncbi:MULTISPECIES: zinc ribbon domain-containing protein [Ruminococcus]|uniref:Zinc-ribbon domain-containing protein n=1 Tax=Ruminococcus difficilis TaxID=2763069 RepID=A0A934WUL9_9FIRM|nr:MULTISPECIES: zinc ribbon domain-containing protein [Ruminococcus]MBK6090289.1 zinc-ribbon domain-containing protein [Ruminococcus difficilis]MEE1261970.1 zinc ribbon domain-containing protein [Ruminococcus sp.]
MGWASIIVPLAIIAALAVTVLVIFLYIKYRLQRFSKEAFGTKDFAKAMKDIERSTESARSVHGMTDIYLPLIQKDFPDFDYDVFKGRVEGVLKSYFAAITAKDDGLLSPDCSQSIRNTVIGLIHELEAKDYVHEHREVTVHQMEIARYLKNGPTVTILFNAAVGMYDYVTDANGKVVMGNSEKKSQKLFDVALVYAQDPDKMSVSSMTTAMGVNCPNCGAPITNLGQKYCNYCGTGIREINVRSWSFEYIQENKTTSSPY